jgi:superfamily I DNA/RNA helicase
MNEHKKHKLAEKLRQRKDTGVDTAPHLIVEARAGTGKTTTLVEGLRIVKGQTSKLIPSPQQLAIWEAMRQSEGKAQTICFVAFNKSIATELQQRVPKGCDAMTMHSMGYRAIRRAFDGVQLNGDRVQDIIAELLGKDIWELRRNRPTLLKATKQLVSLCKMNLVDPAGYYGKGGSGADVQHAVQDELTQLAAHYDVDLNGESREVFALVPRVLESCMEVARDKAIDFDDMIWLPVALGLTVYTYDLLLVDEAQDLNRCQQALAMKAGRRLILCGDPKQAIYGFAGADAESMPRMEILLSRTDRGCETLPLTVTRRCGKAIVQEAKKIVPDFEAHETCPGGHVLNMTFKETNNKFGEDTPNGRASYRNASQDGDMLLCRVNAPLVSECFKFLGQGRKANIQGRDVGQGLISTVNKMKSQNVEELHRKLGDWLIQQQRKENAKRHPSEARLIALQDRVDCIYCFAEDAKTVEEVTHKIEAVFTDDKNNRGIMLSSIHKAKGLEAQRVFLLEPEGATVPHPMARTPWQREQELNLRYVAITRAISELVYVS